MTDAIEGQTLSEAVVGELEDRIAALEAKCHESTNQLAEWQHYASFIANASTLGVPSFAEWKARGADA